MKVTTMLIEQSFEYPLLKEKLEDDFLEMVEYSVGLYESGIVSSNNGNLTVTNYSKVNMALLDLDVIRWWIGKITLNDYVKSVDIYYKRAQ